MTCFMSQEVSKMHLDFLGFKIRPEQIACSIKVVSVREHPKSSSWVFFQSETTGRLGDDLAVVVHHLTTAAPVFNKEENNLAVLAWLCYMSKAENNLSGHGAHCLERSKHPIVPLAAAYVTKSNIEVQLRIGRSGIGGSNVQETLHKNVCMQCRPIFRPKHNLLAN